MWFLCYGAYERNRTGDLFLTKEVLYLLSYIGANKRILSDALALTHNVCRGDTSP